MDQSRQANTRPWYEMEGGGLVPGRGKGRGRLLGFFLVGWGFDKKERPQEGKKKVLVQGLFFEKMLFTFSIVISFVTRSCFSPKVTE